MEKLLAQVFLEEQLPVRKPCKLSYYVTTDPWEEDGEKTLAYGIRIVMEGAVEAQRYVPAMSPDEAFVIGLVKLFAEQKVLPAHLEDILTDILD